MEALNPLSGQQIHHGAAKLRDSLAAAICMSVEGVRRDRDGRGYSVGLFRGPIPEGSGVALHHAAELSYEPADGAGGTALRRGRGGSVSRGFL